MKKLIAELPMLTAPKEKEKLIVYLAAAKEAISTVLMMERERETSAHLLRQPFITRSENKLHPNGKANTSSGRLLKCSFKLGEHDIHYRPRTSVKAQILADFVMERPEDDPSDTPMEDEDELPNLWILFDATNNEAEYEALIAGLRIAKQMGVKNLQTNVDSWLVANQVNGSYIAKEPSMIKYLEKVRALTNTFKEFSMKQVPRGENKKADMLKEEGRTWMTPIHEYLTEEILPEEKRKARAIRRKASRYAMTNGILYKKSFLGPWLRCVGPLHANYVLREIHEGSCIMHAGPRSMVAKALRWYY
ncbi:reverse transcriptase domain-containing protein [Tanacetum coccineum]